MPFPLIIPIVLAGLAALGVGGCATTGRPEDDDDVTPIPPDDDDTSQITDDDTSNPTDPNDADGDSYYDCSEAEQAQYQNLICGDCDDNDSSVHPDSSDNTNDDVDNNCNGQIDEDYEEPMPSVCDGVTGLQFSLGAVLTGDLPAQTITYEGDDLPTEFIGEQAGATAVAGGDVTGDGIDDLVVGSRYWSPSPLTGDIYTDAQNGSLGRVYIVEGGSSAFTSGAEALLSEAATTKISGTMADLNLGMGLSLADPDGDGVYDIFAGAPGYNNATAYEVFSQGNGTGTGGIFRYQGRTGWASDYDAETAATAIIKGANNEYIGQIAKGIGDIDGDGVTEMVDYRTGNSCDIIGLENVTGTQTKSSLLRYQVNGGYWDGFVCSTESQVKSGDINGDGYSDLMLGDETDTYAAAGNGWLLFGNNNLPSTINLPTTDVDSSINYLTWTGGGSSFFAGSASAIADLDGDGKDDVAFGADGEDNGHINSGAAHLLFGGDVTESWNDPSDSTLQNGDDITLGYTGPNANSVFDLNEFTNSKSAYGDVEDARISFNGLDIVTDSECLGVSAVAVGAAIYAGATDGKVFIINNSTLDGEVDKELMVDAADQVLEGAPDSEFGFRVFSRKPDGSSFDFNGDTVPDVVVTAPTYDSSRGAVYVYLGERI